MSFTWYQEWDIYEHFVCCGRRQGLFACGEVADGEAVVKEESTGERHLSMAELLCMLMNIQLEMRCMGNRKARAIDLVKHEKEHCEDSVRGDQN